MNAPASLLRAASLVASPFCDFLNVTVSSEVGSLVADELVPVLDRVGASVRGEGLRSVASGGTFKHFRRGRVDVFGASGQALEALRQGGVFDDYLSALASFPHRVSLLHATADYAVDGPSVVSRVRRLGMAGRLSLTRKQIKGENVSALFGLDADGRMTGTVYLGNRRNADVWAKVYDKRHERLCRGYPDPGPMVRVEVAVQSDVGATIADAQSPAALFCNFAAPGLVERLPGVSPWVPLAEGHFLPARRPVSVSERIKGILDASPDVASIMRLAREGLGANAEIELLRLLAARFQRGLSLAERLGS